MYIKLVIYTHPFCVEIKHIAVRMEVCWKVKLYIITSFEMIKFADWP